MQSELFSKIQTTHSDLRVNVNQWKTLSDDDFLECVRHFKDNPHGTTDMTFSIALLLGHSDKLCKHVSDCELTHDVDHVNNLFLTAVLQKDENLVNLLIKLGNIDYNNRSKHYDIPISFALCIVERKDYLLKTLIKEVPRCVNVRCCDCNLIEFMAVESSDKMFYSLASFVSTLDIEYTIAKRILEKCNPERINWMFFQKMINQKQVIEMKDKVKLQSDLTDVWFVS